jgi:hypothetical protein
MLLFKKLSDASFGDIFRQFRQQINRFVVVFHPAVGEVRGIPELGGRIECELESWNGEI